jgi:hypothetical protein
MSLLEELKQYRESRTQAASLSSVDQPGTDPAIQQVELNETNEENSEGDSVAVTSDVAIPACRGCGSDIPMGRTLCCACSVANSPLVQNAVALSELSREPSLRGRALVALDHRRYPRLQLSRTRSAGPGLIAWCPVLRAGDARTLRRIIELAERAPTRNDDD